MLSLIQLPPQPLLVPPPATGIEFCPLLRKVVSGQVALGAQLSAELPCEKAKNTSGGTFGEIGELSRRQGVFRLLHFGGQQLLRCSALPKIQSFAFCWHFSKSKKGCWGKMHVSPVNGAQIPTGFTGAPLFALCLLCHCSEAIVASVCLARRKELEICLKSQALEAALGG